MKAAYFYCPTGIAGNMILGAFLDAGLPFEHLQKEIRKLDLKGFRLVYQKGTYFNVSIQARENGRKFSEIKKMIRRSRLSSKIQKKSLMIFERLFRAEAKAHREPWKAVHLHEAGSIDAIIDIVGAAIALEWFAIEQVACSPINVGKGVVNSSHGKLRVPGPAVRELLKSCPIYQNHLDGELATPTGAAIIATLVKKFGPLPSLKLKTSGFGRGSMKLSEPNGTQVFIGDAEPFAPDREVVGLVKTNIDDMNPQLVPYVLEKALAAGALDAFWRPLVMKKGRPGFQLTILCHPRDIARFSSLLLQETTSLGVRVSTVERICLPRKKVSLQSRFGLIPAKAALSNGKIIRTMPEFEEIKKIALKKGVPLIRVMQEANRSSRTLPPASSRQTLK